MFLVIVAGFRAILEKFTLTESQYWELNFIVAPISILTFLAALNYALHGGKARLATTLRDVAEIFRDWSPFLFFLLAYEAFRMRIWAILLPQDRDALLMMWDRALFGETPAILLQPLISPALTDLLTLAYLSHLILTPLLACIFYFRDRHSFRQFLLTVLLAGFIGFVGYLTLPAVGPGLAFRQDFRIGLSGHISESLLSFVDTARAPRDVFPSLHVGMATIVLWYSRRIGKLWFAAILLIVLGNWFATLYLRYHYMVDVIAGWIVAAISIYAASALLKVEDRIHAAALRQLTPESGIG